ncbi:hypothetical protein [Streptomyces iconiensis]|uniref:Uncharacterized protein n=1 Tax=Streptomyces iconiensis TaxID=1384038 RepID=A0ABT7A2U7_9ACTN|nr:hypothetical protein [Streptomyces iconiensis]MDJ1135645.1 hypothetical protein [Streptomyces iconiensis]
MDLSALRDGDNKKLDPAITDWDQMLGKLRKLRTRAETELEGKAKTADWTGLNATVTKEFVTKTVAEFGDAVSQATSVHNILKDARRETLRCQTELLDAVEEAKKKNIVVEDTNEHSFLVKSQAEKGEDPPTTAELEAVRDNVKGFLDKATTSDDDAAKALRKLADLSKIGFSDAPVVKDRDHALDALKRAANRQRGIELEKQYKKDTKWPYEWDKNGEHERWGDSEYVGKVGWAERAERPAGMAGPGSLPEAGERIKAEARRYATSENAAKEDDFRGVG